MDFSRDILKRVIPIDEVQKVESLILSFVSEGWEPTVPLASNSHHVTTDWAFVPLIEALLPLCIYLVIVFFGLIVIKKERHLLPQSVSYFVKFFYNFCQIFLCAYMTIESFLLMFRNNYNPYFIPIFGKEYCNIFDTSNPKIAELLWLFYVSKMLDFIDTFLIIVNGKVNQFTFLHIYHHCTIYSIYWLNVNVNYDGDIYFTILFNALIHSIMYTYYLISMHNSDSKKRGGGTGIIIWWKKYLTTMQLCQFIAMMSQGGLILFYGCKVSPPRVTMLYVGYIFTLFILFLKFYFRSYSKSNSNQKNGNDSGTTMNSGKHSKSPKKSKQQKKKD